MFLRHFFNAQNPRLDRIKLDVSGCGNQMLRHGRFLAHEGLRVQCTDAMPGGAGEVRWLVEGLKQYASLVKYRSRVTVHFKMD